MKYHTRTWSKFDFKNPIFTAKESKKDWVRKQVKPRLIAKPIIATSACLSLATWASRAGNPSGYSASLRSVPLTLVLPPTHAHSCHGQVGHASLGVATFQPTVLLYIFRGVSYRNLGNWFHGSSAARGQIGLVKL